MPNRPNLEEALSDLPEKLLVGVSGGIDSVALLNALVATGRKPVVLHFDHAWRAESKADAEWVRELARSAGLKFIGAKAAKSTVHREAEARTARYAFFSRVAKRLAIPDLVLAHQADDQVETYLLQLLRGSGAAGSGMKPLHRRDGLILHRPWLGVWRKEIRAYARRHRLSWREDETNRDLRHRRNLIRGQILPYLQRKISPRVAENLWRSAEIARAESEWLDALCAADATARELDVKRLRASPLGRQRRLVLRWLQRLGLPDLDFADVEAVRGLAWKNLPARVNLSGGKFARRRAGKIFIE
jgi:tRNA(Ile)-lysidine synthetase-like protein